MREINRKVSASLRRNDRRTLYATFFLFLQFEKKNHVMMISSSGLFVCTLCPKCSTLKLPETKLAEFANSVDLDEVAHHEPPHLDLHYLPSSL